MSLGNKRFTGNRFYISEICKEDLLGKISQMHSNKTLSPVIWAAPGHAYSLLQRKNIKNDGRSSMRLVSAI